MTNFYLKLDKDDRKLVASLDVELHVASDEQMDYLMTFIAKPTKNGGYKLTVPFNTVIHIIKKSAVVIIEGVGYVMRINAITLDYKELNRRNLYLDLIYLIADTQIRCELDRSVLFVAYPDGLLDDKTTVVNVDGVFADKLYRRMEKYIRSRMSDEIRYFIVNPTKVMRQSRSMKSLMTSPISAEHVRIIQHPNYGANSSCVFYGSVEYLEHMRFGDWAFVYVEKEPPVESVDVERGDLRTIEYELAFVYCDEIVK